MLNLRVGNSFGVPRGGQYFFVREPLTCTLASASKIVLLFVTVSVTVMSSIPQGAFLAYKANENKSGEKESNFSSFKEAKNSSEYPPSNKKLIDYSPLHYSSKLMNSIWGQYNRYSVHNLKKNTDSNSMADGLRAGQWGVSKELIDGLNVNTFNTMM